MFAIFLLLDNCTYGSLRLVGGSYSYGRVEVCVNNQWGTICDNGWTNLNAQVVCEQLGYGNLRKYWHSSEDLLLSLYMYIIQFFIF